MGTPVHGGRLPVLGLRVAGVLDLGALRQEALATKLTAPLQDRPTGAGGHPGAEPVLTFTGALGGLIGAFHGSKLR